MCLTSAVLAAAGLRAIDEMAEADAVRVVIEEGQWKSKGLASELLMSTLVGR